MSVSQEIDYSLQKSEHGAYKISRVLPLNGSTATLAASSTTEVLLEIPNKVCNLSKSAFEFQLQVAEPTTTSAITRLHCRGLPFDRVSAYTREGVYLCDVNNCDQYTAALNPYLTKLSDLVGADDSRGGATAAAALAAGKGDNMFASNVAVPTATPGLANGPNGTRVTAAGAAGAPDKGTTEQCYFFQGVARDGAAAGQINVSYSVPLSAIHHSILSLNKDVFFNQAIVLRIQFAPTNRLGWAAPSATDIATSAENIANAVTVSGMRLALAVETNPKIVDAMVSQVKSQGMSMLMPYVYSYLYSSPSGTSSAVQQRINRGHGKRLLAVYHTVCNTTSTGRLARDQSNVGNAKIVSYHTDLDNMRMQDSELLCAQCDDYALHKDLVKGSAIQSADIYDYSKVHVDSWRSGAMCEWKERDDIQDGVSLDSERIWAIQLETASAAFRQFTNVVVQRELRIEPSGQVTVA